MRSRRRSRGIAATSKLFLENKDMHRRVQVVRPTSIVCPSNHLVHTVCL